MPPRRPLPAFPRPRLLPSLVVIGTALLLFQIILNRAILGPVGLIGLMVPAIAVVRAVGGGPVGWPERVLAAIAVGMAVAVLAGVLTALSPRGLDASSVAVIELAVAAAAVLVVNRRAAPIAHRHRLAVGTLLRRRADGRAWTLAASGLVLALAGVAVASWAAASQQYGGYVQFWSEPATSTTAASVSVVNASGAPMSCDIAIERTGGGEILHAGVLAEGQGWSAPLPRASAGETAPWLLDLICSSPGASPVYRQLSVDPPA